MDNIFVIVYVIHRIGVNNDDPNSLNVMVDYYYHGENRIITQYFPYMLGVQTCHHVFKYPYEGSRQGGGGDKYDGVTSCYKLSC